MIIENVNKTIELMKFNRDLQDKTSAAMPVAGFEMGVWMEQVDEDDKGNECGTVCCIAGYATLAETGSVEAASTLDHFPAATQYFGISEQTANDLFMPSEKTGAYLSNINDAIKVLEHFRDTGIADWDVAELRDKYDEQQRFEDDADLYW